MANLRITEFGSFDFVQSSIYATGGDGEATVTAEIGMQYSVGGVPIDIFGSADWPQRLANSITAEFLMTGTPTENYNQLIQLESLKGKRLVLTGQYNTNAYQYMNARLMEVRQSWKPPRMYGQAQWLYINCIWQPLENWHG